MQCTLGVDIGTSSSKGVLVSSTGQVVATAARAHEVDRPRPGWVEMEGQLWWEEFVSITHDLLDAAARSVTQVDVIGIGVSGMGPCLLLCDADDQPVRPAILYGVDTRATQEVEALARELGSEDVLRQCGSVLSSQSVGPKIRWVSDHEPGRYARSRRMFMPASWLVYRLSGAYVLDHQSASQCTPLYDLERESWHAEWWDRVAPGLERPCLSWAGDVAGFVSPDAAAATGLPIGTPVIAGTIDAWAEAVSVDALGVGDLMLMYGTTMFLVATAADPARTPSMWTTASVAPGTRNLAGGLAASGAITAWISNLTGADYRGLQREASESGVGARGLLMLPYFAGERTPIFDPDARGVIAGLTLQHGRGDIFRAALEATALGVRHNVETMRAAGVHMERVVAVGGGTSGALWLQIVSDATGLTQYLPHTTIGACYGAALLAARAVADEPPSMRDWNPPISAVTPDPSNAAEYDALYDQYLRLYRSTSDVVHELLRGTVSTHQHSRSSRERIRIPHTGSAPACPPRTAYLVASGDLRESANRAGWPAQQELESAIIRTFEPLGWDVVRAHGVDDRAGHGFIASQRAGLEVFASIPEDAPLIVAVAIWQYSHHVLAGLRTHRGPILTVANFAGRWPGLVGLLGLNAGLAKMGKEYSTLWSVDFTDDWFREGIAEWVSDGVVRHDLSHVHPLPRLQSGPEVDLGRALGAQLLKDKALIGVFDEGCMGMYNAIIDDETLNETGIYKERLSQSALYAELRTVADEEADAAFDWLVDRGMTFRLGVDDATELTREQIQWQLKMYIAAARIADDFGLDAVGIQYQQGLKDLVPASDLAEGMLNSTDRPPVFSRDGSRELYAGRALTHFNEVDECAAVDALVTDRVWTAMGLTPDNTLHDVRWGEDYEGRFVWVYEISGAVPASHLGGWHRAEGWRQGPVFFPAGGSTINGVSQAGEVVLSRVFVCKGRLEADVFRASVVELPAEESQRRKDATNPEWPIAHVVLHGVTRDQFMARHKANHVQMAYAPDADTADRALVAKAAMFDRIGIGVNLVGRTGL